MSTSILLLLFFSLAKQHSHAFRSFFFADDFFFRIIIICDMNEFDVHVWYWIRERDIGKCWSLQAETLTEFLNFFFVFFNYFIFLVLHKSFDLFHFLRKYSTLRRHHLIFYSIHLWLFFFPRSWAMSLTRPFVLHSSFHQIVLKIKLTLYISYVRVRQMDRRLWQTEQSAHTNFSNKS